jgi:hypothetical protein
MLLCWADEMAAAMAVNWAEPSVATVKAVTEDGTRELVVEEIDDSEADVLEGTVATSELMDGANVAADELIVKLWLAATAMIPAIPDKIEVLMMIVIALVRGARTSKSI